MNDKVRGGTPRGSKSLCVNCRAAHLVRGLNLQEEVWCRAVGSNAARIAFPVETCSGFDDKRVPALYQMESIAWNIHSRNRGPIGFTDGARTEITIDPPSHRGPEPQPAQWPSGKIEL